MIKIIGLSKSYGKHEVLKNISMEFLKGKAYGIVGENGAGKTTLFRCIAGLENYNGEIISDNTPSILGISIHDFIVSTFQKDMKCCCMNLD